MNYKTVIYLVSWTCICFLIGVFVAGHPDYSRWDPLAKLFLVGWWVSTSTAIAVTTRTVKGSIVPRPTPDPIVHGDNVIQFKNRKLP